MVYESLATMDLVKIEGSPASVDPFSELRRPILLYIGLKWPHRPPLSNAPKIIENGSLEKVRHAFYFIEMEWYLLILWQGNPIIHTPLK